MLHLDAYGADRGQQPDLGRPYGAARAQHNLARADV
jgi:hypothetical protein